MADRLLEYVNPHPYAVHLTGPDGKSIRVPGQGRIILSEWFSHRYVPNVLQVSKTIGDFQMSAVNRSNKRPISRSIRKPVRIDSRPTVRRNQPRSIRPMRKVQRSGRIIIRDGKRIVGKRVSGNHQRAYNDAIKGSIFRFSNNIGVGILSYQRLESLQRLIKSIRKYTDLSKVTVFVSDESESASISQWLSKQTDIVPIINKHVGIACNTNRILRCLDRFSHKIIINDDVEITCVGWEKFYFDAIQHTGIHHFCFRQPGIYGAKYSDAKTTLIAGYTIRTIDDKPQGAVVAFDDIVFRTVGYCDERFGVYGMEHVDWSHRVSLSKIQIPGYHDLSGSERYFKLHRNPSMVANRVQYLSKARELYNTINDKNRIFVHPSDKSMIPSLTVIIPCRDVERGGAIFCAVAGIRGQLFPHIRTILVEEDVIKQLNSAPHMPLEHVFLPAKNGAPFWKSAAFNTGVSLTKKGDKIILHDADIVAPSNYLSSMYNTLTDYDACHLGKQVLYLDQTATAEIVRSIKVSQDNTCSSIIGYFEGGSLGCSRETFVRAGGLNEEFIGYGIEDCDLFERLKNNCKFQDNRKFGFIHLWHGRSPDWEKCHDANRKRMASITAKLTPRQYVDELKQRLIRKYRSLS